MKIRGAVARNIVILWTCMVLAYMVLFGGNNMTIANLIAIILGLAGVITTLIATFLQLKRDGKTIDGISSDTADIRPTANSIREDTLKTRSVVVEDLKPTLAEISKRNNKIDLLASELEYQKRLKSSFSENTASKDIMLAGIAAVYEENARLNEQHRKDQEQIFSLTIERNNIRHQLQEAEKELRQYRRDRSRDDYEWEP